MSRRIATLLGVFACLGACSSAPAKAPTSTPLATNGPAATEPSEPAAVERAPRVPTDAELAAYEAQKNDPDMIPCDDKAAFLAARDAWLEGDGEDPEAVLCVPRPDMFCDQTAACSSEGVCTEEDDDGRRCGLAAGDCAKTASCLESGRCDEVHGEGCAPRTDEDCEESTGCQTAGRCALRGVECVTEADALDCTEPTVRIDGTCYLPVGYDCESECREEGRCEALELRVDESGFSTSADYVVCVRSDQHCRDDPRCKSDGQCSAAGYSMVSMNKCDGMRFESCEYLTYGGCAVSKSDCAKSDRCRRHGDCGTSPFSSVCQPTSAKDCEQSLGCKNDGACFMVPISGGNVCGTKAELEEQD